MQFTNNLAEYIEAVPGIHVIMTGTFDPPHRGHVLAVKSAIGLYENIQSAIIVPHNWSATKKQLMDLRERIEAVGLTFDKFGSDFGFPVVVSEDSSSSSDVENFEMITVPFRERLIRVAGGDEDQLIAKLKSKGWNVVVGDRQLGLSSTYIKDLLQNGGSYDEVRDSIHEDVLKILSSKMFV